MWKQAGIGGGFGGGGICVLCRGMGGKTLPIDQTERGLAVRGERMGGKAESNPSRTADRDTEIPTSREDQNDTRAGREGEVWAQTQSPNTMEASILPYNKTL